MSFHHGVSVFAAALTLVAATPNLALAQGEMGPTAGTRGDVRDELATETLVHGKVSHGGYGAPEAKLTAVLSEPAMLAGGQAGWIIGHHFVLGGAGYGLVTRHDVPVATRVDGLPSTLEMGYGGVRFGYLLNPESVVHAGFGLLIGAGGLVSRTTDKVLNGYSSTDHSMDYRTANQEAFFVMEPQVEAEVNVTMFFRVAVSGSYRYAAAIDVPGIKNSSIGGPAAGLALRFGSF